MIVNQFQFLALIMKSFIKIIVLLWISQTVCCYNYRKSDIGNVRIAVFSDILEVLEKLSVAKYCKLSQRYLETQQSGEVFNELSKCSDTELISKAEYLRSELKLCIDPIYPELVEKLSELDSKLLKLQCEMIDEDVIELHNNVEFTLTNREHLYQVMSCVFSEPEIVKVSNNVSNVLNFTIALIDGSDRECGVVQRIEKCFHTIMKNSDSKIMSKKRKNVFNILMKSFECKVHEVDEQTDVS